MDHRRLLGGLVVCAAAAAALAASACGSPGRAADARQDAVAFWQAAQVFLATTPADAATAKARVNHSLARCTVKENGRNRSLVRAYQIPFWIHTEAQLRIPAYGRMAAAFASVHAQDPTLQAIAHAASVHAQEDSKMLRAHLGFCLFLRSWQAARWTLAFPDRYLHGICRTVGYDVKRVLAADKPAHDAQSGEALIALGLTVAQQGQLQGSIGSDFVGMCRTDL